MARQSEVAQMQTLIASAGDKDPGTALRAVAALRRLVERLERMHVDRARNLGLTWQEIAEALGVTRQTVHRKHR